ncbi:MAG: hypothetical protein ACRDIB_13805 [Ardenticatenaceae bacterium]
MLIWKRNTDDPLMRHFLDRYYIHLLAQPREGVAVGDLYVQDGKQVSSPGSVVYFLEPPLEMPPLNAGEVLADVSGMLSNAVSANAGLGLLDTFLAALGAAGIVSKLRAAFETKKASAVRFRFASATRDSVDPMQLGSKLIRHKIIEDHPLYDDDSHYYLVTAVVRTPNISIVAQSDSSTAVDLGVEAMQLGSADTGVTVEKMQGGEVTFKGKKSLAFGVQLYELSYDQKRKKLKFKLPPGLVKVRSAAAGGSKQILTPAFIGGEDDDVFLEVV